MWQVIVISVFSKLVLTACLAIVAQSFTLPPILTYCCCIQCQVTQARSLISVATIWKKQCPESVFEWSLAFILSLTTFEALSTKLNPNRGPHTHSVFCVLFVYSLQNCQNVSLRRCTASPPLSAASCSVVASWRVWLIDDRAGAAWHLSCNDRWAAAVPDKWHCLSPIESLAHCTSTQTNILHTYLCVLTPAPSHTSRCLAIHFTTSSNYSHALAVNQKINGAFLFPWGF